MTVKSPPRYHGDQWEINPRTYLGGVCVAGKSVVDIGAASGHISMWCFEQGASKTVGVDIPGSPHRRHFLENMHGLLPGWTSPGTPPEHVEADATDLPFDDNSFDIAILGAILMHLRDPYCAVLEAARVASMLIITANASPLRTLLWRLGSADRHGCLVPFRVPNTHWIVPPKWCLLALRECGMSCEIKWSTQVAYGRKTVVYTAIGRRW